MENEELKEAHAEATEPKSAESEAHGLDLSLSTKRLAKDNEKNVILTALKINNINHDTLNISRSKFNKMNKEQLIEALKGGISQPQQEEKKATEKQSEDFDYLGAILSLKSTLESSVKSGDYKKLDSEVAGTVLNVMNNDENIKQIDIKSSNVTKIIIGLGGAYFLARLIGFETISNKLKEIKNKLLKRKEESKEDE